MPRALNNNPYHNLSLAKATGIISPNCPGRWNKVHRCVL